MKRYLSLKMATLAFFIVTAATVSVYFAFHRDPATRVNENLLIGIWTAFYTSCFCVIAFGCKESPHALEGVVYLITIAAEAVLPDLCVHLMSKLHTMTSCPESVLEITSHLLLTLMSCALLIGWGIALAYQFMGKGKAPVWVRLYVIGAIVASFGILLCAILATDWFVNLSAVEHMAYIRAVTPHMFNIPMSYWRILLTLITMFLPWVRTQMDGDKVVPNL
jgi:hypothetical protein